MLTIQIGFVNMILDFSSLAKWREDQERVGRVVAVTSGCFDLLHDGHRKALQLSANFGDVLLVGLNSDESVRRLKGPGRPFNNQDRRVRDLTDTGLVSAVCIFHETTATEFLKLARPDFWCKGSDRSIDTLDPDEVAVVGCERIVILPRLPGFSTTELARQYRV